MEQNINNENKVIKETINVKKEDIYNFNMYLMTLNKNLGLLVVGVAFIILGIYGLVDKKNDEMLYDILTIVVGVLGILFATVVNKLILKRQIKKMTFEDMPPIEITADDKGILYKYIDEKNQKEYLPYRWNEILRVVKTKDYIFVHINDRRSIMLITIRDLESDDLINLFKNKLLFQKKYIEK